MAKDQAQERRARPEDCPEKDGLELQPAVQIAEDLDEMEAIVARKARPATELPGASPLPEEEAETEDHEDHGFVLFDEQGQPVPGVSATPGQDRDRNAQPTDGEAALRAWRLKNPGRKAEAQHAQRTESLRRTLRGVTLAMVVLLVGGLLVGRALRGPSAADGPQALTSPVPTSPPATTEPQPTKAPAVAPVEEVDDGPSEAGPAPEELVDDPSTLTTDARIVDGTLKHWTGKDGYLYWQWDYVGAEPLDLQWRDAAGEVRMQDRICDGRIDGLTGRCYVGRSPARFTSEVSRGASPGLWTLEACLDGACGVVSRFEIQ